MILFVDCDDTLILWDDSARQMNQDQSLWMGDKYKVNKPLVDKLSTLRFKHPEIFFVVWSGGGQQYAMYWADKFLDGIYDIALSKDISIPGPDDICIDDQHLKVKATLMTAEAFLHYDLS